MTWVVVWRAVRRSWRAALIPQVFGHKPALEVTSEQEPIHRAEVFAQVSARFRKRRQICRCPCRWTRGRRFKSCQPDTVSPTLSARHTVSPAKTGSDLRKR